MPKLPSGVFHPGTTPPKPFVYTFRLAQFRISDTRSRDSDSDTIGYTLNVGQASYTQTLPPVDVDNGNHDVGLEFPGIAIPDPTTTVTLAYAIANAGHDAAQIEALFQKGIDQLIQKGADSLTKGGGGGGGDAAEKAAGAAAAAVATGATFGTALIVAGAMFLVDFGFSMLFADCDGAVAADKIATPRSSIDALFPKGGCVATQTVHYPGTNSPDGCGANSSYYVTSTIIRTHLGDASQPEAGKLFIIAGRSSGLVLDVPGGTAAPGTQIQQWVDNGTAAQHWELQPVDDGYFMIRSSLNGLVLEVADDSKGDHAKVQQAVETDAPNQHWAFDAVSVPAPTIELPVVAQPNSYYQIRSRSSGKVLDVPSGSADPGIKIQQFGAKANNNGNQVWQLVQVPVVPQTGPVAIE